MLKQAERERVQLMATNGDWMTNSPPSAVGSSYDQLADRSVVQTCGEPIYTSWTTGQLGTLTTV